MGASMNYSQTIKEFIIDNFLFGDGGKLEFDTPLLGKGIIDSTGVIELVAFIEDNFNITVNDDELVQDNFSSLNAMDSFLKNKNIQVTAN